MLYGSLKIIRIVFQIFFRTLLWTYKNGISGLKNCLKLLKKIAWNCFKCNIFSFHNFPKNVRKYIRMENPSYKFVWNYSKNHLNCFKYNNIFFFKFFKKFSWIYKDGKLNYKNENIEGKSWKICKITNLKANKTKAKSSLLELEKDFKELEDKELKDSEEKLKER